MRSTFVPAPGFVAAMRTALAAVTDFTDVSVTVSLVEGVFDSGDPDTYPAASSIFTPISGTTGASVEFDAVAQAWFLVWDEPDGGWDFVSFGVTDSVTITGYVVKSTEDEVLGAVHIEEVTILGNDEHIVPPFIALQLPPLIALAAAEPLVI